MSKTLLGGGLKGSRRSSCNGLDPSCLRLWRKLIGREEDYSYLCAALRARAARFYTWEELCSLACGNFESLESEFLEGRYSESYRSQLLSSLLSPLRKIELAVMHEVTRRLRSAHSKALGEPYELMSVILSRGDLHNFRIILRRFASKNYDQEEGHLWHLYGDLPEKFFKDLWGSDSIPMARERIYLYDNPVGFILDSALAVLQDTGNLVMAERELVSSFVMYHKRIVMKYRNKNGALAREFLGRLIDMWNLNLWLKDKAYSMGTKTHVDYLLDGAWIDNEALARGKTIAEVMRGTPWHRAIKNREFSLPQELQWHIQREFWTWQIALFRKDPLGFEVPLGYMAKALVEWSNLNIIAVGTAFGLSSEKIVDRLIPIK